MVAEEVVDVDAAGEEVAVEKVAEAVVAVAPMMANPRATPRIRTNQIRARAKTRRLKDLGGRTAEETTIKTRATRKVMQSNPN